MSLAAIQERLKENLGRPIKEEEMAEFLAIEIIQPECHGKPSFPVNKKAPVTIVVTGA